MKTLRENLVPLSFMLIIPVLNIFYVLLNNSDRKVHTLITAIDELIPFVEIFVVPYLYWYPFILFTMIYICIKNRKVYLKTLMAYAIGLIVCYVTYLVYQTTVPRPILTGDDWLTQLVQLVYSNDKPYNCFPSIHVLSSYLMMKAISKCGVTNRWFSLFIHVNSILIIVSTLFIKQHVILDIVSGILLGEILYRAVDIYYETDRIFLLRKKSNSFLPYKN
jgi:membrane-associated phospholipid phosphatase